MRKAVSNFHIPHYFLAVNIFPVFHFSCLEQWQKHIKCVILEYLHVHRNHSPLPQFSIWSKRVSVFFCNRSFCISNTNSPSDRSFVNFIPCFKMLLAARKFLKLHNVIYSILFHQSWLVQMPTCFCFHSISHCKVILIRLVFLFNQRSGLLIIFSYTLVRLQPMSGASYGPS